MSLKTHGFKPQKKSGVNMTGKLRKGYTTGTCAQAATKAAVEILFGLKSEEEVNPVSVELPRGKRLSLEVEDIQAAYDGKSGLNEAEAQKQKQEQQQKQELKNSPIPLSVSCAVRKDSGDDPDITNGILIYSKVTRSFSSGGDAQITVKGGRGVGTVTKPGLDRPVGEAAINSVPRQMITEEVRRVCEEVGYTGEITVEISIPDGEELAKKTFNPRLGVEGGLSILGTSGIVEPMSEQALLDTIYLDMRVKLSDSGNKQKTLVVTPGNYGLEFLEKEYGISEEQTVKCSNYIGQTIDMAMELGCKHFLLVGHIGKLVKVSGGIMNTHSKWADCRMELLAAAALAAGIPGEKAREFLACVTVDDAFSGCREEERRMIMEQVMRRMEKYLSYRVHDEMKIDVMTFSKVYGILGKTGGAEEMLRDYSRDGKEVYEIK